MKNKFKRVSVYQIILAILYCPIAYSMDEIDQNESSQIRSASHRAPKEEDTVSSQLCSLQSTMLMVLQSQQRLSDKLLDPTPPVYPSLRSFDELSANFNDLLLRTQKLEDLVTLRLKNLEENLSLYNREVQEVSRKSQRNTQKLEKQLRNKMGRPGSTVRALMHSSYGNGKVVAYLMDDNTIRACGEGQYHANGNSSANNIYLPQLVSIDPDYRFGRGNYFKGVYAAHKCFFALTADGKVYSWGFNTYGQLGHGDTTDTRYAKEVKYFTDNRLIIREVISPTTMYRAHNSIYFLTDHGEVYATGNNTHGQLGDGSTSNRNTPVRCGNLRGINQLVASSTYETSVYALEDDGKLWSWGYNTQGQLGLGDDDHRQAPMQVTQLPLGINNVPLPVHKVVASTGLIQANNVVNGFSMIIIGDERKIYSCGSNQYGQLGRGNNTNSNVFVEITGNHANVQDIQAGGGHYGYSALVDREGSLWTWGCNSNGELGLGDNNARTTPNKPVVPFQGKIQKFKLGGDHNYNFLVILTNEGELWGSGYNGTGQLGLHNGMGAINRFQRLHQSIPPSQVKCLDFALAGYSDSGTTFS